MTARTAQAKMVNGRIDAAAAESAARVLKQNGLTISSFIRNSLNYVARQGEVPACGFPATEQQADVAALKQLICRLEAKEMPGKADYPGLGEDQMVERMLMERYGY